MKKLLPLFVLVILSSYLSAQSSLSSSHNLPRPGDRLVKQQVVFKDPGPSGLQVLWDFSEQESVNENYELKYSAFRSGSDTIVGTEHRTMYYYHSRGDSLILSGYENPTTLIRYRKPESLLVFPLPYGRSFTDYFDGKGNYCDRFSIHVQGKSVVAADGMGQIVLPGGDTLQHVLRVHTTKRITERFNSLSEMNIPQADSIPFALNRDSIDYYLANDSNYMDIETWRWYAEGYRYPVFETIKSTMHKFSKSYEHFSTSFYYPPHEQYYDLAVDSENQMVREFANEPYRPKEEGNTSDAQNRNISYNYYVDEQNNLYINYALKNNAKVAIIIYDLQGRQLSSTSKHSDRSNSYQEIISMSNYPSGEYMLQITADGEVYGEKVIKR